MAKKIGQIFAALAASISAFCVGTMLGWPNPTEEGTLHGEFGFACSIENWTWVTSLMTLGAALSCIPAGIIMNKIGRRWTMLLMVIPFLIGWFLLVFAVNIYMMFIGRFIIGFAGGTYCVTTPMYTGEIAEKEIRGTLGSFFQFMITLGILFTFALGVPLTAKPVTYLCAGGPVLFAVFFFFMPESPSYLVEKGNNEQAARSLKFLRGGDFDPSDELKGLKDASNKGESASYFESFKTKEVRKAMLIGVGLMFFQQLSGINAVMFYSTQIFKDARSDLDPKISTVVIGVIQVLATFIAVLCVDLTGRKVLLYLSAAVMGLSTMTMGVYFYLLDQGGPKKVENIGYVPLVSLCVYIVMFSVGYGPVPWIMLGELFAPEAKGSGGAIAGTSNWVFAFVVSKTFDNMNAALGPAVTFWIFSAITLLGILFVMFVVPETKNKSLEEIQTLLG